MEFRTLQVSPTTIGRRVGLMHRASDDIRGETSARGLFSQLRFVTAFGRSDLSFRDTYEMAHVSGNKG
jgi:hypothetical protein